MFQDLKGPINPTLQSSYEFLKDFFKEVWFVIKDIYLKPDFVIERRNMLIVIDNSTSVLKVILSLSYPCLLYTSPSPRDATLSRMPSSA